MFIGQQGTHGTAESHAAKRGYIKHHDSFRSFDLGLSGDSNVARCASKGPSVQIERRSDQHDSEFVCEPQALFEVCAGGRFACFPLFGDLTNSNNECGARQRSGFVQGVRCLFA